ncbi:MAG: Pantothenate synthetase, partial [Alphaproteobacteria bacterium MarineAlpha5_Bin11]
MIISRDLKSLNKSLGSARIKNFVGLIPTMGAIHSGHLSLVKTSKAKKCLTCVSIFINPTQFNQNKDFEKYPRNENEDLRLLEESGCDIVFIPPENIIYPSGKRIAKTVKNFRDILCDKFRPNHFDGVTTVVKIFFDIFKPHYAFFGEKDYQQLIFINEMVKFFNLKTKIISCESIRDKYGMSLSSRYQRLNKKQKIIFQEASKIILDAFSKIRQGQQIKKVTKECNYKLNDYGIRKIEYLEVRNENTMQTSEDVKNSRF